MENKVKFPESKRLIDNVIMFMSKFDKNFSVSTLAKLTNYNYKTVSGYANGIREAGYDFAYACVSLCRTKDPTITFDQLFGFSNEPLGQTIAVVDLVGLTDEAISSLVQTKEDTQYHLLLSYIIENNLLSDLSKLIKQQDKMNEIELKAYKYDIDNWSKQFAESLSLCDWKRKMVNKNESLLPIPHYSLVANDLTKEQANKILNYLTKKK